MSNLTKKFGDFTAVDHLNLEIEEGEIFGLLGPNGAGKTTALLMLTTVIKPTEGTATVSGCDIRKSPDKAHQFIGISFQEPIPLPARIPLGGHKMVAVLPTWERGSPRFRTIWCLPAPQLFM